jgi:hypothetical protein
VTITSEPSAWRLRLARHLGAAYARNPRVATVLIAGSVSRGHADRDSDIELMIGWSEPPSDEERGEIVAPFSADLNLLPFDAAWQCWQEDFFVGRSSADMPSSGVLVEAVGQLTSVIERRLADVLERHEPDLDKQTTVHALLHGIPLHGEALIGAWRARASTYPRELAVAVVDRFGQIDYFADWKRFLARGNNLLLIHDRFTQVEQQLLLVLQAINGQYHYKFKWLDRVISELAIGPPDLGARLRGVQTAEVPAAAEALRVLVEEVYDLVEAHLPEVDINRLREIFRWERHPWDSPPPMRFPSLD